MAFDEDNESHSIPYGYGLFSLGAQTTSLHENYVNSDGVKLKSEFVTTSPYIMTGSQTRVNDDFSFSIMAASTLLSSVSGEQYFKEGTLFDEHKASYYLTELQVNVQYRINAHHQFMFGSTYTYESIKRYAYSSAELLDLNASMIENRAATLNVIAGYRYSSHAKAGDNKWRYVLSIEAGLPVLLGQATTLNKDRKTDVGIDQGWSIKPNLYLGYKLAKGLELGIYADYLYKYRRDEFLTSYSSSENNTVTLVDSYQLNARYGLAFSWNYTAVEILDNL